VIHEKCRVEWDCGYCQEDGDDESHSFHVADLELGQPRHPLSERFHAILKELGALHDKKQADYGRADDPFANVRASTDFGIAGWVGALVRANDKMRRLQKAAQGGALANEGVLDSLNDLAVYAVIARVLYEQEDDFVGVV
jgi:hypothetical protein